MPPEATSLDIDALRRRLAGDAVVPGDSAWDTARMAWNLAADQHPAAVVLAEHADDVAATVAFAGEHGLRVAPQGPGHGARSCPRSTTGPAAHHAHDRRRDRRRRPHARAEAGALWSDVVGAATEHGLTALHGSSADVGVVGYTLGGGLGWLARKHGFACNRVTGDRRRHRRRRGAARRADNEPDLFWALRGGGGGYAIVTALSSSGCCRSPRSTPAAVIYPAGRRRVAGRAYREWAASVPDEVTSDRPLLRLPPVPTFPSRCRERRCLRSTRAVHGRREAGGELVAPLRDGGEPIMDTCRRSRRRRSAGSTWTPSSRCPGSATVSSSPSSRRRREALLALRRTRRGSPLLCARAAPARRRPHPGRGRPRRRQQHRRRLCALRHRNADLARGGRGDRGRAARAEGGLVQAALAPDPADPLRSDPSLRSSFADADVQRLAKVKDAFDPDGLILSNHTFD